MEFGLSQEQALLQDQLSRFLDRGVREKMERVVPRVDGTMHREPEPAESSPIDLRALLRGRFGA